MKKSQQLNEVSQPSRTNPVGRPRRLTDEQALTIRKRYKGRGQGETFQALAKEYGVTRESITSLIKGQTYTHLPVEGEIRSQTILSEEQAISIIKQYKGRGQGPSYGELGEQFGVKRMVVRSIVVGLTFKHLDREAIKREALAEEQHLREQLLRASHLTA